MGIKSIMAGALVFVAWSLLLAWWAYGAGVDREHDRAEARQKVAIQAALQRRDRLEELGRGISRGIHERAAERATRAEEQRRRVLNADVFSGMQCLGDDSVREFNRARAAVRRMPGSH